MWTKFKKIITQIFSNKKETTPKKMFYIDSNGNAFFSSGYSNATTTTGSNFTYSATPTTYTHKLHCCCCKCFDPPEDEDPPIV